MIKDTNGREFAKLNEIKAGDTVEIDEGFTCRHGGKTTVYSDDAEGLYILCHGFRDKEEMEPTDIHTERHCLDGQLNDQGTHYVGIFKV